MSVKIYQYAPKWYICNANIKGIASFGAGTTAQKALEDAFKSYSKSLELRDNSILSAHNLITL